MDKNEENKEKCLKQYSQVFGNQGLDRFENIFRIFFTGMVRNTNRMLNECIPQRILIKKYNPKEQMNERRKS